VGGSGAAGGGRGGGARSTGVCVCVCVRARAREREVGKGRKRTVCVWGGGVRDRGSVSEWEREGGREGASEREREEGAQAAQVRYRQRPSHARAHARYTPPHPPGTHSLSHAGTASGLRRAGSRGQFQPGSQVCRGPRPPCPPRPRPAHPAPRRVYTSLAARARLRRRAGGAAGGAPGQAGEVGGGRGGGAPRRAFSARAVRQKSPEPASLSCVKEPYERCRCVERALKLS